MDSVPLFPAGRGVSFPCAGRTMEKEDDMKKALVLALAGILASGFVAMTGCLLYTSDAADE